MSRKMLIESDPHQTGVAVLEDDRLTEIFIELHRDRSIVGNVYKGRVTRVLPGMQAAFVDIGLERDAFLYVSDVLDENDRGEAAGDGEVALEDEAESEEHELPATESASIEELLQQGQEILVQVLKAPLPNKGARITAQVTLPGRYLVLLPMVQHFGVSRRIEQEDERARLLKILEDLAHPQAGLIVRTVGEGKGLVEFATDQKYLLALWENLQRRAAKVSAPSLVHRDLDPALRVVRDLFNPDFNVLLVDGEDTYARIVDFLDQVQPSLVGKVKLRGQEGSLFERFGIPEQVEAALKSKVWLKSGGYIVINQTEALVAIDVNTGRYVGHHNLEDTVLRTNLEAVKEIVRQVRLRDLGGIIVADLIDMVEEDHRRQVFEALEAELAKDRSKNKVLNISEFGLVEITRKRSRASLERQLTRSCPYCSGRGRIQSVTTICLNIRRQLLRHQPVPGRGELLLRVHPEVAQALQQEEQAILDELESRLGVGILIQADSELHHEKFDFHEV